jgi:predicted ester cyclase
MMGEAADVMRMKIAAFNTHDPEELRPVYRADVEPRVSGSITLKAFDDLMGFYRVLWDAFPDITISLERVVEQGQAVFVEGRAVGTHTGPLREPSGALPPTGRRVDFAWAERYDVEDGVIANAHLYYDTLVILDQLGLAPVPAHA